MTAEIEWHRARQRDKHQDQLDHAQAVRDHLTFGNLDHMSDYQHKQLLGWLEKYEDILHANIRGLQ